MSSNQVAYSDNKKIKSRNVSSVCHSWQLCWLFLCWENNEINLRITEAALGVVKETTAKPLNMIGVPCSITIPENIQISDEHLIYIAERTTGLVKLDLLGSSRITARGFAKALYNWENVQGICFGKLRHEYFDQVIEEIGKNYSMLQIMSLRMSDFHINRHNAHVIIKNLHQMRALRFEGASICSDGMEIIFFSYTDIKVIQLWRCFLKDNEGDTDTANPIYSFPMSITFTFTEHAAWCRKYIEVPTGFDWDESRIATLTLSKAVPIIAKLTSRLCR
ncbi:hypothetical protein QYF36_019141 [Acer negundo]|nr:hypothetical protein QYF36_019141 [Acer negundo]